MALNSSNPQDNYSCSIVPASLGSRLFLRHDSHEESSEDGYIHILHQLLMPWDDELKGPGSQGAGEGEIQEINHEVLKMKPIKA